MTTALDELLHTVPGAVVRRFETPDEITIRIDLPGIDPDGLAVFTFDHTVTVEGPGLRRDLTLPDDADVDHLHTAYLDDVLELRAPKTRPQRRPVPVHTPFRVHSDVCPI